MPSIVFGLFGNAFFCVALGLGFSILSGGLTLACMILPLMIRATEEGLRAVPQELRLGAAALGLGPAAVFWRLLLPVALPGLAVGLVLGMGRALAETAALLFTSGYVDRMPTSLLDSGRALSIHVYDLAMNVAGGEPRAYATALILSEPVSGVGIHNPVGLAHRAETEVVRPANQLAVQLCDMVCGLHERPTSAGHLADLATDSLDLLA